MKTLLYRRSFFFAMIVLVGCVSLIRLQGSQKPVTPSPDKIVAIRVTADLSTNMCSGGSFLIIDHPFTNENRNIVFGAVNTLYEDQTSIGQFPNPNGFEYFSSPTADCPPNKWLMTSVTSGTTYVFTATKVH